MFSKSGYHRERNITHFLYVLPNLVLYSTLTVLPIVLGLYYSFTDWNGISKKYNIVGLANYMKILSDRRFSKAVFFNLRYAAMLIICIMVLAIVLGLLLNAKIKGQGAYRAIYFFPACISMLTIGLIANYIFFQGVPSIGRSLGIEALQNNILSNRNLAIYGILITNVWKSVAIPTVLVISALQTIPKDIQEAAILDGSTGWQRFWKITVPYILPILSIIFVLVLKEGLMIYDLIMALTSGGPAGATESITLSIYRIGFEDMKFGYAISEAMLVAIIIAIISIIQIRFTDKRKIYD